MTYQDHIDKLRELVTKYNIPYQAHFEMIDLLSAVHSTGLHEGAKIAEEIYTNKIKTTSK